MRFAEEIAETVARTATKPNLDFIFCDPYREQTFCDSIRIDSKSRLCVSLFTGTPYDVTCQNTFAIISEDILILNSLIDSSLNR